MDGSGGWNQSLTSTLQKFVTEVKVNSESLFREFEDVKTFYESSSTNSLQVDDSVNSDLVLVSKKDLWRLRREIRILRDVLPQVINADIPLAYGLLKDTENELAFCQQQLNLFSDDRDHWKTRCEVAVADLEKQQEAMVLMEHRVREVSHQLLQQSEYCANMGAACATLLWRVSRQQDSIESILSGSQVTEFLSMVISTIESYARTYTDASVAAAATTATAAVSASNDQQDNEAQEKETEFVLALLGITTNIAASSFGRDFLLRSEEGCHLVDTFATILQLLPVGKCTKLKTLLLMTVYNISINQSGWKRLRSKSGFITLLVFLVKEERDVEMRLNCLRLIQSLLYDDTCLPTPTLLLHEAREVLTPDLLQLLSSDACEQIQMVGLELRAMFGRHVGLVSSEQ